MLVPDGRPVATSARFKTLPKSATPCGCAAGSCSKSPAPLTTLLNATSRLYPVRLRTIVTMALNAATPARFWFSGFIFAEAF
jgi:hypothetical protein